MDGVDEAFVAQDSHSGARSHVGDPVVLFRDARRRHLVAGSQLPREDLLAQDIGQEAISVPVHRIVDDIVTMLDSLVRALATQRPALSNPLGKVPSSDGRSPAKRGVAAVTAILGGSMRARIVLRRYMSAGLAAAVLALGGTGVAGSSTEARAAEPQQRIVYTESATVDGVLTFSLVSMNADGSDRRTLVPTGDGLPRGKYVSPVFSPDGRHLAFISEDGFGDIWVAEPDGSGARPVVMDVQDPDGWVDQLAWGPNGDMLYLGFQSKPGHDRRRLMKVNLDGSGLDYVLPDQPYVFDGQPSVAPNGVLAFLRGGTIQVYDPRQGGTPTPLTSGLQPAYSPDGTKLAFTRQAASSGPQVFVRDLASGKETQITDDSGGVIYPSWSPDGSQLAYLAGGTDMRLTVHSATAAGGPGTAITSDDVQGNGRPAWVIPARTSSPGDLTGDGRPDLIARDSGGVLWLYRGTGSTSAPYAARTKIGGGWNTYTVLS
ncbi:TolB family protein [Streptomyces sp. NPDC058737]|uniref:TolB family protein n=1 Tax=Streptomyces sp. NPDC058737 TaxID=3346617 RepID=UPI0036A576F1